MAIRLITKTTGNILAPTHCRMFYMAKGNNLEGKPYGIIPTTDDDPLGLVFDEEKLTVSVKPGQVYCYGRQCIITETSKVVDLHDWKQEKCFGIVMLRVDISDVVNQFCELKFAAEMNSFPDTALLNHSNIYQHQSGTYDVPIAQFVYSPDNTVGKRFTNYKRIIPTLTPQARPRTQNILKIGSTNVTQAFSGKVSLIKAKNAEASECALSLANTPISADLDGVWTGMRVQLGKYRAEDFRKGTKNNFPVKIDNEHLVYALLSSASHVGDDPQRDVYLMFPTKIKGSGSQLKSGPNVFAKLDSSIENVTIGSAYYLTVKINSGLDSGSRALHLNLEFSADKTAMAIAKVTLLNNALQFEGLFDTDILALVGGYLYYLGSPSVVIATKDGNWWYGNGGKGFYADFLYKGDVNVS